MKRAFIKTLYKIIDYLYTKEVKGEVTCNTWRVGDKQRWELSFNDKDNICKIVFVTKEL